MKILSIAYKDLQILAKDRGTIFQLLLLPLLFIIVFSGALNSIGQGEKDTRIVLPVVNLDNGESARQLIQNIDGAGGVRTEAYEQANAQALLDENKINRMLVIPAGFTQGLASSTPVKINLISHPKAQAKETEALRLVVDGAAADMELEAHILNALRQMGQMQAGNQAASQVFSTERVLAQARSQFARAKVQPLVAVSPRVPKQEATTEKNPDFGQVAIPGFAILFVFMTAQNTAHSIHNEKQVGSFRRLMSAPLSKAELLAGKLLPNFIVSLVQITIIFLFGSLGLRLLGQTPLPVENAIPGVILVSIVVALCSSAFGILLAAIARTEGQISGLGTLLVWITGLLGGCIAPLFILEPILKTFPMIVPQYWANRALDNLLFRGVGVGAILPEMGALLGFTVLFFLIGLWRFDFD